MRHPPDRPAAVALALAFTGPGAFALDPTLGLQPTGVVWDGAATVVAVATAVITLAVRRPQSTPRS